MAQSVIAGSAFERSGATLLARVVGRDALPINQAALSAIRYEVWDVEAEPPSRVLGPTAIAIAGSIFDALQQDARWTVDAVGYNFRFEAPAAAFPQPRVYRVDLKFTPVAGETFRAAFEIDAIHVYAD